MLETESTFETQYDVPTKQFERNSVFSAHKTEPANHREGHEGCCRLVKSFSNQLVDWIRVFFRIFKWIFLFQVQNLFFFFSFFLTQKRFLLKTVGVGLGMMAQNHLTAFHIPFALCSFTLRCLC